MSVEVRKGREILGMPVYSNAEGRRLGEVTGLFVRRSDSTVAALRFGEGGRLHHLPYQRVRVGIDAVLIDSEAVLEHKLSPAEVRELDTGISGRPVLTVSGRRLGTILGFRVDTASGRIEAYRVRPESGVMAQFAAAVLDRGLEIPVSQVQSLGADALIVTDEAGEPTPAPSEEARSPA